MTNCVTCKHYEVNMREEPCWTCLSTDRPNTKWEPKPRKEKEDDENRGLSQTESRGFPDEF